MKPPRKQSWYVTNCSYHALNGKIVALNGLSGIAQHLKSMMAVAVAPLRQLRHFADTLRSRRRGGGEKPTADQYRQCDADCC
jgi:hypothetical protein